MITRERAYVDGYVSAGAMFSDDERERFALWRLWANNAPWALFVMLNPSTADEMKLDPTVTRCQERARRLGAGGLVVVNIFPLRSTDPKALRSAYAAGHDFSENDQIILRYARVARPVICAWGNHGRYLRRGNEVRRRLLMDAGVHPLCFKVSKQGEPVHPLYQRNDARLIPLHYHEHTP